MKTTAYCRVTAVQKSKGHSAAAKIQYIERTGRYKNKPGFVESGNGNLPPGFDNFHQFWQLADQHERANSVTAREFLIDLPDHVPMKDALKIARHYANQITRCPETERPLPYSWAVHANEEGHSRHMHLVMSERIIDGIERDPETFFKQQIKKTPERGGAPKLTNTASALKKRTDRVKNFIQRVTNRALEQNGLDMTVDFKRTVKQGKQPQIKLTAKEWATMKSGKYQPGTSKRIDQFIAIDRHNAQVQLMLDDLRLLDLHIKGQELAVRREAQQRAEREAAQQKPAPAPAPAPKPTPAPAPVQQAQKPAPAPAPVQKPEPAAAQKPEPASSKAANLTAWASQLAGSARAGMNAYLNARGEEADAAGWVDAEEWQKQQEQDKNRDQQRSGPKL